MGDGASRFERLVRPVLADLYGFARRLTRDPVAAEDLLQQALLRGLTQLGQLHDDRAFKVWQSRVLYTTFLNGVAATRRREGEMDLDDAPAEGLRLDRAGPDDEIGQRRMGDAIARALAELPAEQRDAVLLVDGQGFGFGEAAAVLGVRPGTLASRVARGRSALRERLGPVADELGLQGVGR